MLMTFTDLQPEEADLSRGALHSIEDELSDSAYISRFQDYYHRVQGEVNTETAQWAEEVAYLSKRN